MTILTMNHQSIIITEVIIHTQFYLSEIEKVNKIFMHVSNTPIGNISG